MNTYNTKKHFYIKIATLRYKGYFFVKYVGNKNNSLKKK